MRAERPRRAALVALLLGLGGCGGSPGEVLTAAAEPALSWTATVRVLAEHWTEGRVPTPFARATLQAALLSLERQRSRLTASPKLLADPRAAAAAAVLAEASAATSRAWAAVGAGDREGLRAEVLRLDVLAARLRALRDGRNGAP
jgi:hypothetical protein